jgi:hypothetical protein
VCAGPSSQTLRRTLQTRSQPDLQGRSREADGADDERHRPFWRAKTYSTCARTADFAAFGAGDMRRHRLGLRFLAVDVPGEAARFQMRRVPRRAVGGVRPDPARGVGLVEQRGQLRAVVAGGVGGGLGADQSVAAVDADIVLVAEDRDGDVHARRRPPLA